ncbi:ABC transporter ATP-binding protein [Candidatus Omnitrophus magneticus]|uniref:ABC transporter ATP-binding protein n=1 Tax=Candidatus Omnitrophus magneticus TaxID=1609969 RepID=A0A0F0CLB7_9BACT|nr:ABC transporter ATP-binding protein [Candidatus Omnitrophus magneticus]
MNKEEIILFAEGVSKFYRQGFQEVKAVRKVDMKISKGERLYIHGPSGAGKSTLLHLLGALSRPTSGKIFFKEKNIYKLSDRARSALRNKNFGFIFQFYYLLPELNVLENVMLPGYMKGGFGFNGNLRARALEILGRVGMTPRLRHRPNELSGGEAQRVAIARALINSPEILFCDEPTGNLDSVMSGNIYDLILKISEEKKMSVVIVSHGALPKNFFHTECYMRDGVL